MRIVTAAEMQAMDHKTITEIGIPGRVLMENAGRGATRCFLERIYAAGPGRVGIIAGRGNNGGDGFVIARYLAQRGIDVQVFLLAGRDQVRGDAAANLDLLATLQVPIMEIPDADRFSGAKIHLLNTRYWIDAIFGTGLNADVKGYFKEVIDFINAAGRPVFAVDIPSGLNADTGQACGVCIQAAATATFGYAKIGHLVYPGADCCGAVDVIDIGIPPSLEKAFPSGQYLMTGDGARALIPGRSADSHKGRTGHLLVVAGAIGKTGAAGMTAMAALRIGTGLVTLGVPQTVNPILEAGWIEVMTVPLPDEGHGVLGLSAYDAIARTAEAKNCVALGPGMGTAPETCELIQHMLKEIPIPMVIDADGLNCLGGRPELLQEHRAPAVLTPHPGEMARLIQRKVPEIQHERIAAARELARRSHACVILKGARTLIAEPAGAVWINPTGNAGMASGGMGDVLTGAVAGLLAQGLSASAAARLAVYLHGMAADLLALRTSRGYLATEVMHALPQALQQLASDPPPSPVSGPLL